MSVGAITQYEMLHPIMALTHSIVFHGLASFDLGLDSADKYAVRCFSPAWPDLPSAPFISLRNESYRLTWEFPKLSYKAHLQPWISCMLMGATALVGMVYS